MLNRSNYLAQWLLTDWRHNLGFLFVFLLGFWLAGGNSSAILSLLTVRKSFIAFYTSIARHVPVWVLTLTTDASLGWSKWFFYWANSNVSTGSQCKELQSQGTLRQTTIDPCFALDVCDVSVTTQIGHSRRRFNLLCRWTSLTAASSIQRLFDDFDLFSLLQHLLLNIIDLSAIRHCIDNPI